MEVTKQDIEDMRMCGRVGKNMHPFADLWFALKDKILISYGLFDGHDVQVWDDPDWDYPEEIYATHEHILKRYVFADDKEIHAFHLPTNEFHYWRNGFMDYGKKTKRFDELRGQVKNLISGKKLYLSNEVSRNEAWKALKRLIKKFGFLLRSETIYAQIF
jgi:hypothetical protein